MPNEFYWIVRSHDLTRLSNKPGAGFPANSFLTPCLNMGGRFADPADSAVATGVLGDFRPSAVVAPAGAPSLQ